MKMVRVVLGDQLSRGIAALADLDSARDVVLMAEVAEETGYVPHHRKKIAFFLSAMRHFADELRAEGIAVDYVRLDDPSNSGSLAGEVARAVLRHGAERVVATFPGEWRVLQAMRGWGEAAGVPVEIREDNRFICSRDRFERFAGGRRQLRMEFFYREMRRETGLLMEPDGQRGEQPAGGRWNFDPENRKSLPPLLPVPEPFAEEPDAVTREVLELVARRFPDGFGDLEPFGFAVDRAGALRALERFLRQGLPWFGDFQDAMRQGDDTLFHSVIAQYLNVGLLDPLEVCRAAEGEWRAGRAPLNAVEGFVRQILGWREYVRGLYWLRMPGYAATNALGADRPLPSFYWTGETDLNCLARVIGQTRRTAYAHHIQRLMVTGNFALLAGLRPQEVGEWYLAVYADAVEWVELPNTHGMALFADGGVMASKPYAASGRYIDRMSDYCRTCRYDVTQAVGPDACPMNALYWAFLMRHERLLSSNPRMGIMLKQLAAMPGERRTALKQWAEEFLDALA